ncbi:MAG: cobalt-precorrin-6A reductase [Alphaproteobacteria bacterium]
MADRPKVLILGGTAEAVALSNAAAPTFDITYSLAGRTRAPSLPDNVAVRSGGFGGASALSAWMLARDIDLLVDATHPFAEQISINAKGACEATGTPRLRLLRPAWEAVADDDWHRADDIADAARKLPALGATAFLSVGRQELSAFAGLRDMKFLVRTVDPLDANPLPNAVCITGRGPFTAEQETALLQTHGIDVLVSKNAGGDATYAKIVAARQLGLPVVMIDRPPPVPGDTVDGADRALDWMEIYRRGCL